MQLMTYNEILTLLCDSFDSLIAPRTIARSNTNIIYLMFKAIAKGYEVINNVCVTLSNKFDPAKCSNEDLVSVASIVGTEKLEGSASGLEIIISNTSESDVTLIAGVYTYSLDDDTSFVFEMLEDTLLQAGDTLSVIAMSQQIGSYPVTAQESIEVKPSNGTVPDGVEFSCTDNTTLLGTAEETDLEFRKRILTDTTRQDSIKELEIKLKNLPYLYDAKVKFNNSMLDYSMDGYTIPPYTMAIFFNGSPRNEIAEVVASNSIYPTLQTADSVTVHYVNDVFVNGSYDVNIIPFKNTDYVVNVHLKIDQTYITYEEAHAQIKAFLLKNFRGHIHADYVKEDDIYEALKNLSIAGVNVLNIDLLQNGSQVPYVTVPLSRIPYLDNVLFTEV